MDSSSTDGNKRSRVDLGKGELWALGAAVAYALYQVFLKVAVGGEGLAYPVGATVQALPLLVIAVALGWLIKRRGAGTVSPFSDWKLIGALAVYGLLLFAVATPLLFAALQLGGVLITSPLAGTQVLWGAVLAALLLREPFSRKMALGMVVSVVGIAALTWGGSSGAGLPANWWLAVPFALGAGFCWAMAGVLLTYNMRRGVDGFQALAIGSLVGVVAINIYLLATGGMGAYAGTPGSVLLMLLVAGTFSGIALIFLTSALAITTVASATTLNSLQVAIGPVIAWLFLGETMNLLIAAGILLILAGVIVVQQARAVIDNG